MSQNKENKEKVIALLECIASDVSKLVLHEKEILDIKSQIASIAIRHEEAFGSNGQFQSIQRFRSDFIKRQDKIKRLRKNFIFCSFTALTLGVFIALAIFYCSM